MNGSSVTVEIKARCADPARLRAILRSCHAIFKGRDHQIDTYFRIPEGRLKLREGNIEKALIYYKRNDQKRSKRCDAILCACPEGPVLKKVLAASLGVLTVVDKMREIYFVGNVERLIKNKYSCETPPEHPRQKASGPPLGEGGAKFHIDRVKRLGSFVEIEVFGTAKNAAKLKRECEFYQKLLGIRSEDLVADSYSDQLLRLET